MKLDKDTLVKQQFWFLLGGYLLVWVAAVFWLKAAAGEPIENAKKAFDGDKSQLQSAQRDPVNVKEFIPPWEKQFATFNGYKTEIWMQAWGGQKDMYNWPQEWMNTKDMETPQTPLTDTDLSAYRHKYYPNQIESLAKNAPEWLDPIEWKGGFNAIFNPTNFKLSSTPTREECWLLQEDYWVKRELFAVLWKAMGNLAFMSPVKIEDDEKTRPEGVVGRHRYRNENWEITLNLHKDKGVIVIGGDSTIKNVHPTRRTQSLTSAKGSGIVFNVAQDKTQTRFMVQGEPLAWEESRPFNVDKDMKPTDFALAGIKWAEAYLKEHPVLVSQAFDKTTSPIRRLNALKLCQQDCRTYIWPLQTNQELAQLDAQPEDPDAKKTGDNANPGMTGMPNMTGMSGMQGGAPQMPGTNPAPGGMSSGMAPNMGGGAAVGDSSSQTPNNNIERNRYLRPANQEKSVNPPSRHLPFALQLIVEQSHVNDVQLALANSRLRVQITQSELHHAKDYSPKSDSDSGDMAGPGRFFMGPGMPSMYPGMGQPGYGGGMTSPSGMPNRGGSGPKPPMPGGGGYNSSSATFPAGSMPPMPGGGMGMPSGMTGPMLSSPPPTMQLPAGMGNMPGMMPPGVRPGVNPPTGNQTVRPSAANQTDDNLVEVTIYGIATLYRRPDLPKTTEQPAAPAAPMTPGGPTPAIDPKPTPPPLNPPANPPTGQQPAVPPPPVGDKR